MPNIKLQSSDGQTFNVDVDIAKQSIIIKTMLEDLGLNEGEDEPIPLPNVNGVILNKVIDWCIKHKDYAAATLDTERSTEISQWDKNFLKPLNQGTLFEIILAANYLDIKGLLDVACKAIAQMIKGKTPEEIRKTFNIKNDFTPEEEDQIAKETGWCQDMH